MKTILTVHATGTAPGLNLTTKDVDRQDRRAGFRKIGYHYVIERDGTLGEGRGLTEASMHDPIRTAKETVSVCLVGGFDVATESPADNFTDEQWDKLRNLARSFENVRIDSMTPALTTERVVRQVIKINR
jgi:N-acetylmuramoyl-L-alanine amidase